MVLLKVGFKFLNIQRNIGQKKVNFNFRVNYNLYKFKSTNIDICYLADTIGSMEGSIKKVKKYCVKISDILNNELCDNEFGFGVVFYADPINVLSDYNRHINLTPNINEFKSYVDTINLLSDGDGPEDWSGGYLIFSNKILVGEVE